MIRIAPTSLLKELVDDFIDSGQVSIYWKKSEQAVTKPLCE